MYACLSAHTSTSCHWLIRLLSLLPIGNILPWLDLISLLVLVFHFRCSKASTGLYFFTNEVVFYQSPPQEFPPRLKSHKMIWEVENMQYDNGHHQVILSKDLMLRVLFCMNRHFDFRLFLSFPHLFGSVSSKINTNFIKIIINMVMFSKDEFNMKVIQSWPSCAFWNRSF